MSITKSKKTELINENARHKTDTGSERVQIAILTERIRNLTEHLKIHKKDFSCQAGLLKCVSRRKSLIRYIMSKNLEESKKFLTDLGIRH